MDKWIDISQPLNNRTAYWPGDTPFSYKLNWVKAESGSVNVGQIGLSTHLGTHVDAPFHFDNDGRRIHELDLGIFIGPARLIHIPNAEKIGLDEVKHFELHGVERLLIHTGIWLDRTYFPSRIPGIEPELAEFLKGKGIKLLGVDLPSVDELDSKHLPAHHKLHAHDIHILEGLVLDHVEEGEYFLSALPLSIENGEGSPVRAVIKKITA